jgi:nicotinate-nucleotide adenylyltransferase
MNRVGILGGTFDPPHNAHITMAETALERVPLDRVLLMPPPNPPQKNAAVISRYEDRVEMVRLAVAGREGMEMSLLEEFRDGPSYTADLVEHFKASTDDEPYLILGADSVADLGEWRDPERILAAATLVVFPRTGFSSRVPVPGRASIILFESPVIDVSSSDIRDRIRNGEDVGADIPGPVCKFILDNELYT